MGAGISLAFTSLYPHRVKRVILNRPAWLASANPPHLAIFPVIAGLVERLGIEPARREFQQTAQYKELQKAYPASAESLLALFSSQDREALAASLQAIPASAPVDSLDVLSNLEVPSLVLGNRNDPIHPFELAETLARKLPGSRFQEFPPKSGGLAEHYRQFRRLISEFLREAN